MVIDDDPNLKPDLPYEEYVARSRARMDSLRRTFTEAARDDPTLYPSTKVIQNIDPESILVRDVRIRELRALHGLPVPPIGLMDPWDRPPPKVFSFERMTAVVQDAAVQIQEWAQNTLVPTWTEIFKALDDLVAAFKGHPRTYTLPARAYRKKYPHGLHSRHPH